MTVRPFPDERTVVVTGAVSPRGIGRATVNRLAADGWGIGIIDRDAEECAQLATELRERYGIAAHGVAADVSDRRGVDAAVLEINARLPQIVGLVNIAGVSSAVPYLDVQESEWDRVIAVNLTGTHLVSQAVARIMVEHKLGRIVNMSSVSAQRGGGTFSKTPYSAAKAGVVGLTRALARELGPYHITVNAVSPGPVDTDIMGGPLSEERRDAMAAEQFIDHVARPDEIAATIAYLLREDSEIVTGQTLNVNGGLYMS